MGWLRKIWNDVIVMCFMMAGISPPEKYRNEKKDDKKGGTPR